MTFHFSDTTREHDPHALPDIEVFFLTKAEVERDFPELEPDAGWFWWTCLPGCLPDSDPVGPFTTSDQALEDARGWNDGPDDDSQG